MKYLIYKKKMADELWHIDDITNINIINFKNDNEIKSYINRYNSKCKQYKVVLEEKDSTFDYLYVKFLHKEDTLEYINNAIRDSSHNCIRFELEDKIKGELN